MIDAKDLGDLWDKHDNEFLKFDRIANPLHPRPDLCAFLLLDRLSPHPGRDIVVSASHDEFYLDVSTDEIAAVATEEDVVTLIRCGLRYDRGNDSFCMFT